jgi:5-methylcytosine-specific restriction protein A
MPSRPPLHKLRIKPAVEPFVFSRVSPQKRGYDWTWTRLRLVVLADEPLCRFCFARGQLVPATDVDHIKSIAQRPDLRLVRSNLRPLCHSCHSTLTGQQRGHPKCV